MNGSQVFNRFDFNHHLVFNQQINPTPCFTSLYTKGIGTCASTPIPICLKSYDNAASYADSSNPDPNDLCNSIAAPIILYDNSFSCIFNRFLNPDKPRSVYRFFWQSDMQHEYRHRKNTGEHDEFDPRAKPGIVGFDGGPEEIARQEHQRYHDADETISGSHPPAQLNDIK